MADNYTANGTYFDGGLGKSDKAKITELKAVWERADAAGDTATKDWAHEQAELIRSASGYSGGVDGSEFIPTATPSASGSSSVKSSSGSSGGGSSGGYIAYSMPAQATAEKYIKELYAAQADATLNALKSAYEQNVQTLDDASSRLPDVYNAARNRIHGESEIERSAFNERAASQGLGSGAGSQVRLSFDNALLGNLGAVSREEAGKNADLMLEKSRLETAYKNSVAEAKAKNDYALAKELYEDAVRVNSSLLAAAKAQADENYKAYTSKY
jgi:hypothetical protein